MFLILLIRSSGCVSYKISDFKLSKSRDPERRHLDDRYIDGYEHEGIQNPISENNRGTLGAPKIYTRMTRQQRELT